MTQMLELTDKDFKAPNYAQGYKEKYVQKEWKNRKEHQRNWNYKKNQMEIL